ncbi:Cytosine-specific methyltransferase [Balamuthia mandrillaris]
MQTTVTSFFRPASKRKQTDEPFLPSKLTKRDTIMQDEQLTVVSLFCGAGGMDLGFVNAGFNIVYAVDNDKDAVETYRKNIGGYAVRRDVASLRSGELPARCSVLIGGPPCQGFSIGGNMDARDERNLLVWQFARLVEQLRPPVFVMENVTALATHKRWHELRSALLHKFEGLGYTVTVLLLNARHYGVAQSRERAFFIGTASHLNPITEVPPLDPSTPTVYDVLKDLPPPGSSPNLGPCKAKITLAKQPDLRKSPYSGHIFNGGGRPVNIHAPINTLLASMGGNKTPILDERALRTGRPSWFEHLHRRLLKNECPAENETVPSFIRRLSVTEASLLQSFPLTFCFMGAQSSQFRQIGNAVPPKLAQSIASAVLSALQSSNNKKSLLATNETSASRTNT